MTGNRNKKPNGSVENGTKNSVQECIDAVLAAAAAEAQLDSFFRTKAEEIMIAGDEGWAVLSRAFQKGTASDRAALLQLMRFLKGFQHIEFLQNFIARDGFQPRIGMRILELLNRSDIMLPGGVASRLMELDNLTQRLKLNIDGDCVDETDVEHFCGCAEAVRQGVLAQLVDETGPVVSRLIQALLLRQEAMGLEILNSVCRSPGLDQFRILQDLHTRTGRKDVAKLVKKMARTLQQKGVAVEALATTDRSRKSPVFQKAALPPGKAFSSKVDAEGYRIFFLVAPVTTHESKIFHVMLQYGIGIREIEVMTSLRKNTQKLIDKLLDDTKTEFVEIDIDQAAFLVQEARRMAEENGRIVSANIKQLERCFRLPEDIDGKEPPVYDLLGTPVLDDDVAGRCKTLLDESEIRFWYIASTDARVVWDRFLEAREQCDSPDDAQLGRRIVELKQEARTAFFTPERLKVFKRMLEENAWFAAVKGNRDFAGTALSVASRLDPRDESSCRDTFCKTMLDAAFCFFEDAYTRMRAEQQARTGCVQDTTSSSA